MRLALLEDDIDQAQALIGWLQGAGHQVQHFARLQACRQALRRESFDILILDWGLPDGNGIDLLAWLRDQDRGRHEPVIFTTARNSEADTVAALDAGADDYLVKPVRRLELLSRLDALWRRAGSAPTAALALEHPPYRFDLEARRCEFAGEPVDLTEKEFAVAVFFFRNLGNLISRSHLLEAVWGLGAEVSTRTVDTHVSRLRVKLALRPENGYRLAAVYNFGYRLEALEAALPTETP